ncbi:MAG: hypothetical protein ACRD3T_16390 [Terriglobia bacterium]
MAVNAPRGHGKPSRYMDMGLAHSAPRQPPPIAGHDAVSRGRYFMPLCGELKLAATANSTTAKNVLDFLYASEYYVLMSNLLQLGFFCWRSELTLEGTTVCRTSFSAFIERRYSRWHTICGGALTLANQKIKKDCLIKPISC